MCRWLNKHGLERKLDITPREFEEKASQILPSSIESLSTLTRVFEKARYSSHEISKEERDIAIRSLREIMETPIIGEQ